MDPEDEQPRRARRSPFDDPFFAQFPRSLFHNFEREFERMQSEMNEIMRHAIESHSKARDKGEPFVYGFTMRVGPDGRPQFQHFGDARPGVGVNPELGREPLTDVMESDKEIAVTVELPGIAKEDVNLHVAEEKITIRTEGERRYYKQIPLPAAVVPKSAKATFKNGILDITIQRQSFREDPGERIPIE